MRKRLVSPSALDEYFASGFEETENPFITANSRSWGKHVPLLGSLSAAFFLFLSYILGFYSPLLSHLFLLFVYFLTGTPALITALKNLLALNVNIQVLMTMAALLSVLIGSELEGGLLLVLFALSEALEETVTKKTKGALHALHKLSPSLAYVVESNGLVYPKAVKEIALGTKILIKAGEIVPLDGIVLEGSSYVNLAHLTGESVPVSKRLGNVVQAGSLNMDGTLTLQVTKTSGESTLAKIIKLITEAQSSKPKLQRLLDHFSRSYATSVILLSFFFGIFLPLIFPFIPYLGKEGSIYRALAFLIAASPCALIIATPTAYLSAISACARKGLLLKGGIVLDALASCKVLAFDKTGTLTTGKLTCQELELDGSDLDLKEALRIAVGLERAVVHPIAEALTRYAEIHAISAAEIADFRILSGKGVEGFVTLKGELTKAVIGNVDFITSLVPDPERQKRILEKVRHSGHIVTLLLVKESLLILHFTDEIRPHLKPVIEHLQKKLDLVMLTGDHKENAFLVASSLGIENVHADLLPEDKLRIVRDLARSRPLIMVGDGINDAPALAQAMVGIAMGEVGSATAIEAADVVLLRDDLSLIDWLHTRAKKTRSIVRQNVALALLVIASATLLSLFGFIPLWLAVVLHEGSTVTVGLNSLRLLTK